MKFGERYPRSSSTAFFGDYLYSSCQSIEDIGSDYKSSTHFTPRCKVCRIDHQGLCPIISFLDGNMIRLVTSFKFKRKPKDFLKLNFQTITAISILSFNLYFKQATYLTAFSFSFPWNGHHSEMQTRIVSQILIWNIVKSQNLVYGSSNSFTTFRVLATCSERHYEDCRLITGGHNAAGM